MVAILDSYFGSNGPLMVFNFIAIIFLSIKKHTKAIKKKEIIYWLFLKEKFIDSNGTP